MVKNRLYQKRARDNVIMPYSLFEIGTIVAFRDNKLKSVVIPNPDVYIRDYAFDDDVILQRK